MNKNWHNLLIIGLIVISYESLYCAEKAIGGRAAIFLKSKSVPWVTKDQLDVLFTRPKVLEGIASLRRLEPRDFTSANITDYSRRKSVTSRLEELGFTFLDQYHTTMMHSAVPGKVIKMDSPAMGRPVTYTLGRILTLERLQRAAQHADVSVRDGLHFPHKEMYAFPSAYNRLTSDPSATCCAVIRDYIPIAFTFHPSALVKFYPSLGDFMMRNPYAKCKIGGYDDKKLYLLSTKPRDMDALHETVTTLFGTSTALS